MLFCCRIKIDWAEALCEGPHVLAHRAVLGIVDRQHEPTGAFGPRWDPLAVSLVRSCRVVEARRIRLHEDGLQLKAKPAQRFLRFVGRAVVGQVRIVRMGPEAELIALDQVGLNHRFHARPPTLMPSTALASAASCWPSVLDELPTKSISRSMTLTVSCEGWANSAR